MFSTLPPAPRAIRLGALLFAVVTFTVSWWHWWTFQYGTFDLAFYVQAMWLALRGQWTVSLLGVPLMGNHAEPIVFLLAPLFAICPHPMLFVVVQTLALASMPFTAWRIARRLDVEPGPAIVLALATILTPATILVGLYEFHPEAFAAPLLLLLIEARRARRHGAFWLWFLAVLGVKENMALLLVAWCVVFGALEWRRGVAWLWRWNALPCLVAAGWLLVCATVIGPRLNAGHVDYLQLYAHLGGSGGEIVKNFFVAPQRALGALWRALTHGNLLWALILPLLLLPLFRLRWWLIASPVLLQHLLSWRYSEWSLGAHYPAPLIPLFWIAAAEMFPLLRDQRLVARVLVGGCVLAQVWAGPWRALVREAPWIAEKIAERQWKAPLLAAIPRKASVVASQPFLSHLAKREQLISLHHILKGLKTLSRESYGTPAPTDVVLIDYADGATFSTQAGFYHPRMRTAADREVASSDRLLHEFLRQRSWHTRAVGSVTLFKRGRSSASFVSDFPPVRFDDTTTLLAMQMAGDEPGSVQMRFVWEHTGERARFPWMMLVLNDGRQLYPFVKGACAPEAPAGRCAEEWTLIFPDSVPAGTYTLHALFYDANEAAWRRKLPPGDATYTIKNLELGARRIAPPK
jgi:uncharacterized membrane protein